MLNDSCVQCGAGFGGLCATNRLYCSQRCKRLYNIDRLRTRDRETKRTVRAQRTPEQISAQQAYMKAWRQRNAVKVTADLRAYYLANKATAAHQRDHWRRQNPEAHKASSVAASVRRRALKRGTPAARLSGRRWRKIQAGAVGCFYCGQRVPLTMDHVVPLARGGSHSEGNIVAACDHCNKSKGHRLVIEWRNLHALEAFDARRVPDSRPVRPGLDQRQSRSA